MRFRDHAVAREIIAFGREREQTFFAVQAGQHNAGFYTAGHAVLISIQLELWR